MKKKLLAVIFALKNFCSYLIVTKVTIYSNHAALRYLLTKKDVKPWLIRWIFLLQEFDLELKDKRRGENLVANHLTRMVHEEEVFPLHETFLNEQLLVV